MGVGVGVGVAVGVLVGVGVRVAAMQAPTPISVQAKAGHGAGKPTAVLNQETADVWVFLFHALEMGRGINRRNDVAPAARPPNRPSRTRRPAPDP